MYDYHVWANQQLLQHLKQLPDKVYTAHIESVFSSISEVLIHLYATDIVWLETMKGSSFHDTIREVERRKSELTAVSIDKLEMCYDELSQQFQHFFCRAKGFRTNPYYRTSTLWTYGVHIC